MGLFKPPVRRDWSNAQLDEVTAEARRPQSDAENREMEDMPT